VSKEQEMPVAWRKKNVSDVPAGLVAAVPQGFALSRGKRGEHLVLLGFAPGLRCAQRLRELGLTEGKTVVVLHDTDPVLLALDDSRIALERSVGDGIEVGYAR
jgi:Fe2+ transport system protein FeoA